ncbi:MAG TPA: DEAD/DEAH box helicase family protein [Anaeromyxobacteraceae bacterium]|nr:DEAD/DEAH box helicase family protein [Anaeromyxobacteraceae bacterium]
MRLRYDRGTVLLSELPPGQDLSDLPGVLWDGRVAALRAPAVHLEAIRAELAARGVRAEDQAGRPADLPVSLVEPPLRPYQDDALWAWQRAGRRGLVVLPTGSGKTRLAVAAIARCRGPALVLVPTRALLGQWAAELGRAWAGPIGCLGDGERRVEAITVATFESGWRQMDRLGDRFRLLVVDEVHHFGDGLKDEALELCAAPARLGLTATPPSPAAVERLGALVGPIAFELAVGDLAGRWLAPFELVTLRLDLDDEERAAWERAVATYRPALQAFRRAQPGAGWADFARAAGRTEAGRRALDAFRSSRRLLAYPSAKRQAVAELLARHAAARVLVFTADNATAYAVAREQLVMPITCDISRAERAQALERFRRGELRALVSARVLNEGIDVPDAEVAVVVGGTQGEREHVQRIGRLLRPAEGKSAVVYELVMRGTSEVLQARRRRASLAARQPHLV